MRKLLSITFILLSLAILMNCSPKTAKKTASSEKKNQEVKEEEGTGSNTQSSKIVEEGVKLTPPADDRRAAATLEDMGADQQLALFSDMAPLRVEVGKKLYTTNCNKCHEYYSANSRSAEKWVDVMRTMGPKAKLNTDQYLMVAGYLVQNAKK